MATWNWWQAVKLGCISLGVAALQFLKFALLDEERRRAQARRRRIDDKHPENEESILSCLSPELRQSLIGLIDYHITPVLVDQWRYDAFHMIRFSHWGDAVGKMDS